MNNPYLNSIFQWSGALVRWWTALAYTLHSIPSVDSQLERLRTDTTSCGDSKQKTESVGISPEQPLVIDFVPPSHDPRSIDTAFPGSAVSAGAAAAGAPAFSTAASAPVASAAATAENYVGSSTASPSGVWAGKTIWGKRKTGAFSASAAALVALLLLFFTAPSVITSSRHRKAEAQTTATEEATPAAGSAVRDAAGSKTIATAAALRTKRPAPSKTPERPVLPSVAESLELKKGAKAETAATEAATEAAAAAAAAAPWSLEATEADARWLANRLKTGEGDAALQKILKGLTSLRANAPKEPIPDGQEQQVNLERERRQQQREQHDEGDKDVLGGGLTAESEGSALRDLPDGVDMLMKETGAALASEVAALKREKLSLTKAQVDLQVLMEDAGSVMYGIRERTLTDYVAVAQAACDAITADELKLHLLKRRLQRALQGQPAAASVRPGLLLKQAVVALKAADAVQARSKRLLNDGLQWCKLGEHATLLCARERFFQKKMNLVSMQLATHLERLDAKSASAAALLAAGEDAKILDARVQQVLALTEEAEAIVTSTDDSYRALDAVQTVRTLLSLLRSEQKNASSSVSLSREEAKARAAALEREKQQQGGTAADASRTFKADADKQSQKSEGVETETHYETEESWGMIASLIKDVLVAANKSLVFHLDKPLQRESANQLLATLPSQEHYEKWKEAHANAQRALRQMRRAAAQLPLVVTGESMDATVLKFYGHLDTFRRHAREAAMRFYLCKGWEQAEGFLNGEVEEYKSALNALAPLRGEDKATAIEDTLSWKVLVEDAAEWGVFDLLSLTELITEQTLEVKDEIARRQAGFKITDENIPAKHNKLPLKQQGPGGQQEQLQRS
ncbi:hypothetical protein Emed_003428 [Eimeria media]